MRWAGLAYESWVASFAAAPLVLLYPLFLVIFGRNAATIVAMSFLSGLAPVVLKTKEGLDGTRRVLEREGIEGHADLVVELGHLALRLGDR